MRRFWRNGRQRHGDELESSVQLRFKFDQPAGAGISTNYFIGMGMAQRECWRCGGNTVNVFAYDAYDVDRVERGGRNSVFVCGQQLMRPWIVLQTVRGIERGHGRFCTMDSYVATLKTTEFDKYLYCQDSPVTA